MKELLRHLFHTDPDGLQSRTLLDCHVKGVHSIVLYDTQGTRLRMFYATKNHGLTFDSKTFENLPVGFHPHHCDVSLYVLQGTLYNFVVQSTLSTGPVFRFNRYGYYSAVTGEGRMEHEGYDTTTVPVEQEIEEGSVVHLRANVIHTVGIDSGETCIWAVMEGEEDSHYDNFLLTTRNLDENSTAGLYNKPSMEQFNKVILEMLDLL